MIQFLKSGSHIYKKLKQKVTNGDKPYASRL